MNFFVWVDEDEKWHLAALCKDLDDAQLVHANYRHAYIAEGEKVLFMK